MLLYDPFLRSGLYDKGQGWLEDRPKKGKKKEKFGRNTRKRKSPEGTLVNEKVREKHS